MMRLAAPRFLGAAPFAVGEEKCAPFWWEGVCFAASEKSVGRVFRQNMPAHAFYMFSGRHLVLLSLQIA